MPLVSIGVPFLNPGVHFRKAIRSVFAQTFPDWELILIDDGSTDGSLEAARAIRSERVFVHSDGRRKGLPARLNQIAELARGDYLVRMDADDIMHPLRVQKQIEFLKRSGSDAVMTRAWIIDERDAIKGKSLEQPESGRRDEILAALKWGPGIHPTLAGSRAWFLRNPYDPRYPRAEDRELFARVMGRSRIEEMAEQLFFYRRPDGVPARSYLQSYASERKVLSRYGKELAGFRPAFFLILRSWAKSLILGTSLLLGAQNRVLIKAYPPLTDDERTQAETILKTVLATTVPGWDD